MAVALSVIADHKPTLVLLPPSSAAGRTPTWEGTEIRTGAVLSFPASRVPLER